MWVLAGDCKSYPASATAGWGTYGKLLNLSVPQLLHLNHGNNRACHEALATALPLLLL